jgi:glycosyltransferase involved in cell wall biosynthesis
MIKIALLVRDVERDNVAYGGQALFAQKLKAELSKECDFTHIHIPHKSTISKFVRPFYSLKILFYIVILRVKGIHLIHVFSPCASNAIVEKLIISNFAKLLGIKVILNLRSDIKYYWENRYSHFVKKFVVKMSNQLDFVLVQFSASKKFFKSMGVANVQYIYNGIATKVKGIDRRSSEDSTKFLYIGDVSEAKGVGDLIRNTDSIEDSRFTVSLYGACTDEYLLELIDDSSHFEYLGILDHALLHKAFNKADCFIFPSRHEGFPNSVLEAMSFGLPILSSYAGALDEIIHLGKGGWKVDFTKEESKMKLREILKEIEINRTVITAFGNYNFNLVEEEFNIDEIVPKYLAFYEAVLRG